MQVNGRKDVEGKTEVRFQRLRAPEAGWMTDTGRDAAPMDSLVSGATLLWNGNPSSSAGESCPCLDVCMSLVYPHSLWRR